MPPKPAKPACPVCGKPASALHTPFCGQGCRDRDLLQWLGEGYRLPGPPADERDFAGNEDE
ncbi:MAG: DNA gyrase inhibitor YacG [Sphingomonadaceae bacterium]|nr:DNA gyrase inhibitor YacG [Sphingomonadaceae bacterium]